MGRVFKEDLSKQTKREPECTYQYDDVRLLFTHVGKGHSGLLTTGQVLDLNGVGVTDQSKLTKGLTSLLVTQVVAPL